MEVVCCMEPMVFVADVRVALVMVLGTGLALVGVVENVFLFVVFARQKGVRRSSRLTPLVLSALDLLISLAYLMRDSVTVYADYYHSLQLHNAQHAYLKEMIVVAGVAMTSSSFLLVFWTMESWLRMVKKSQALSSPARRAAALSLAVALGGLLSGPTYLGLAVREETTCQGSVRYNLVFTELVSNMYYGEIYMFYIRNLAVILPSVILVTLSISLVRALCRGAGVAASAGKDSVRTLIAFALLLFTRNAFDMTYALIWHMNQDKLHYGRIRVFVKVAPYLLSVLRVLPSALRLPVYLALHRGIRGAVAEALGCRRRSKVSDVAQRQASDGTATESTVESLSLLPPTPKDGRSEP